MYKRKPGRPKSGHPRKLQVNITIDSRSLAILDILADKNGLSRSAQIVQLINLLAGKST